MITEAS